MHGAEGKSASFPQRRAVMVGAEAEAGHSGGLGGLRAGGRILDHQAMGGVDSLSLCCFQEHIG